MSTERLLIFADTHLPMRTRDLLDDFWRALAGADLNTDLRLSA